LFAIAKSFWLTLEQTLTWDYLSGGMLNFVPRAMCTTLAFASFPPELERGSSDRPDGVRVTA
jgi:hypothetical protein